MLPSPSDRIFLEFGSVTIYYYGLIMTAAILTAWFFAERNSERLGLSLVRFEVACFVTIISGIIGARLYHIFILYPQYYLNAPFAEMLSIWNGGIAIHGALIGGFLGFLAVNFFVKLPFLKFFDVISPAVMLGQAIGRWGNYFNQEAYGRPTDLPWGIYIEDINMYVHPTFFYESVLNAIAAVVLFWLLRKKYASGVVFMSYLGLYGLNRALIEPLRMDSSFISGVPIALIVSLLLVVVSLTYFGYNVITRKNTIN